MTPLRQRMLEDMQLRGLSARTQGCYVAAVRQLAEHFHTNPAQLTEEQLRQYFLYLANEKHVARTTATIALCAIRFLYEQTLQGGPVTRSSLQSAFRRAWRKSGMAKRASVHTLRHSYGTHLHEAGVSLRVIQEILGHRSVRTTQIYTHLTSAVRATLTDPLNDLMSGL